MTLFKLYSTLLGDKVSKNSEKKAIRVKIDKEIYFKLLEKYGFKGLSKGVNELLHLALSGRVRDPFKDVKDENFKRRLMKYYEKAPEGVNPETYAIAMAVIELLKKVNPNLAKEGEKALREYLRREHA